MCMYILRQIHAGDSERKREKRGNSTARHGRSSLQVRSPSLRRETTLAVAEVVSAHLSVSGGSRPAESFSDGFSSCKRRERDSSERDSHEIHERHRET